MPMTREQKIDGSLMRFYAKRMGGDWPNYKIHKPESGPWQFWRVSDDGSLSECGTSYYHRDGTIEFYGSLRPDDELFVTPNASLSDLPLGKD